MISVYNVIFKREKDGFLGCLFVPFLVYFLSIIVAFIVDVSKGQIDGEFVLRNISLLIIPLFVFSSSFSKVQILTIMKKTSLVITSFGLVFVLIWIYGYFQQNNQQELQKDSWFKNEFSASEKYISKKTNYALTISPEAIKPSLRKIVMLSDINLQKKETYIVREITLKIKQNEAKDVWLLLRGVHSANCRAWFNASTGKVGKIEGTGVKANSEKHLEGYFKFSLANRLKKNVKREWYYISFVSENGSYSWNKDFTQSVSIDIKDTKFFLDTNVNLLNNDNIFKYKLTSFSNLENYGHSTYFGLIFVFALIVFVFNSFYSKVVRVIVIILNLFFIITLASKAIILSVLLIIPIYFLYYFFNYKNILVILSIGVLVGLNSHVKERFSDMYLTIIRINNNDTLGDLETLSTNNRLIIYKNYLNLIKENYLVGFGYKNGASIVKQKHNYSFNAHNQYLQSLFYSGISGFLLLILFTFSPFVLKRKKTKRKIGLELVIIIILFNFLFESLLSRQWGLVFVGFSYSIYLQFYKNELKWFR